MRDFLYDPENGKILQTCYKRYAHGFKEQGKKVTHLCRKRPIHIIYDRFKNCILQRKPSEVTRKETPNKLDKLFGKTNTVFNFFFFFFD